MESIKRQNEQLQKTIEYINQEIDKQKEMNAQNQVQIETLFKFNERLLGVIENQVNKKERCSLQPISERSQRESDLMISLLNSFDKPRKPVQRSQRGYETHNSCIQHVQKTSYKLNNIFKEKEGLKNWIDKSCENQDFSEKKLQFQTNSGGITPSQQKTLLKQQGKAEKIKKIILESEQVKFKITEDIADLKKSREQGAYFYDKEIKKIKDLSSKLNLYNPSEQIKNISQNLSLSKSTSDLIQQSILKRDNKK